MSFIPPEFRARLLPGIPKQPEIADFNPQEIATRRITNEQAIASLQPYSFPEVQQFALDTSLTASTLRSPIDRTSDRQPIVRRIGPVIWGKWNFTREFKYGEDTSSAAEYTQSLRFTSRSSENNDLGVYRLRIDNDRNGKPIARLKITFNKYNQPETIQLHWDANKDPSYDFDLESIYGNTVGNEDLTQFLRNFVPTLALRNGEHSSNTLTFHLGDTPHVSLKQRFYSDIGFHRTLWDRTRPETITLHSGFIYDPTESNTNAFQRKLIGFGQRRRHRSIASYGRTVKDTMTPEEFAMGVRGVLALIPQPNQEL